MKLEPLTDQNQTYAMMTEDHVEIPHWPVVLFLCVLLACGLIGNTLILYVYQRRMKATIFAFFVQIVAVVDVTTVLVAIPGAIIFRSRLEGLDNRRMCKFLMFMMHFMILTSGFLFCVIAIQRYRKICCPHGRHITKSLAAKLSLGVCFTAFALSLPTLYLVGVSNTQVVAGNTTIIVPVCDYDTHLKLSGQSIIFAFLVDVEFLGIAIVLSGLYFCIGNTLRQRSQAQTAKRHIHGAVGTKVFAILTLLFIMSVMPIMVISTIFSFYRTPPVLNMVTKTLFDIGGFLSYINSIVNPIVYSFNSKLFRQECFSMWPCIRKRKPEDHPSTREEDDTPTCTTSI